MTRATTPEPLVLVVEDYQDAREMYSAYLQFSGYRVAEATNGVEAIEQAQELMPDIILMDLALPGMSGIEGIENYIDEVTHRSFSAAKPRDGGFDGVGEFSYHLAHQRTMQSACRAEMMK